MESKVETHTAKDEEEFVSTVNFLKTKMQETISSKGKVVVGFSGLQNDYSHLFPIPFLTLLPFPSLLLSFFPLILHSSS